MVADRLNKDMYILSLIAGVFLPLGFLTGPLGINVSGIPDAENSWAFWLFCALLAVIVGAQVYLFRRMNWFWLCSAIPARGRVASRAPPPRPALAPCPDT